MFAFFVSVLYLFSTAIQAVYYFKVREEHSIVVEFMVSKKTQNEENLKKVY